VAKSLAHLKRRQVTPAAGRFGCQGDIDRLQWQSFAITSIP
jgi:hypothetical protein